MCSQLDLLSAVRLLLDESGSNELLSQWHSLLGLRREESVWKRGVRGPGRLAWTICFQYVEHASFELQHVQRKIFGRVLTLGANCSYYPPPL
jgi:hypothetical protein